MSGWLERLKKLEMPETALTELTKAPSVSFVSAESGGLEVFAPPSVSFVSAVSAPAEVFTLPDPTAAPVDNLEPTTHCPACGSPSFWRSPASPTWRCSWCEPRPVPVPEGFESLTLASGQWAPGCAPPAAIPVTVDGLLAIHGETVAGCRTLDVLGEADDTDLPDFLADRAALEGFARALVADRRIRPLPDASLPTLHRLALELGDDLAELRRWLDQSAQGRRIRARIEREAGACDRALLALRADPVGGLQAVLLRGLDGDQGRDRARPDDGRVQDAFGTWFTVQQRRAIAALDAHHWRCDRCRRAGRGYGERCAEGARLHAATRTDQ